MTKLRIVVSGLVGMYPVGGVAWDYLQYVIGLDRLGHDVVYHEDTWCWPYHPIQRRSTEDATYSTSYLSDFFARYAPELSGRWHYVHLNDVSHGMAQSDFHAFASTADLFLNVSGANSIPDALSEHCLKVFVDTDPGYNQIVLLERPAWSENVDRWSSTVRAHDRHVTYAELIDDPSCQIPHADLEWTTTRTPIVMDLWATKVISTPHASAPWTTVMTWNTFRGPLTHNGREYFGKGAEFAKIERLPSLVNGAFELAVGGSGAPVGRLEALGWKTREAPEATLSPQRYQQFLLSSRGEISTAKHVYVSLRTGWFSCRSACYLASGRPAILQDTGFSRRYPVGEGLLAFSTEAEAIEAIERVEKDYALHQRRAREIAEECFASATVLRDLLGSIGL